MKSPTVIFQLTAIGKNPSTLATSVRSVLYWLRETPRLLFRHRIWVVIEPDGYAQSPQTFEQLRAEGAEVFVVPKRYTTALGMQGKARALQYASEMRTGLGLSNPSTWVYHQDEETCVGEDTLHGISDFVREGRFLIGSGVILYPIDWTTQASHVQELTRSYDDFRVLDSMTLPGNPMAGFHGSHVLVRADVEDAVGWDAHGSSPAEDLTFEIRLRARYGSVFGVLRGFAYEKGAFTLGDQLRQRRRWAHGVLNALRFSPDLPLRRRLTLIYSFLSWVTALPSVLVLVASIALRYGPLLFFTGVFTGFVWVSMVTAYLEGYRLHLRYIRRPSSVSALPLLGIVGALVDVIAPWYGLVTRHTRRDFISKDRPIDAPAPGRRAVPD